MSDETECCTVPCSTRFCPYCGKCVNEDALSGLVWHIEKCVKMYERDLQKMKGYLPKLDDTQRAKYLRKIQLKEQTLRKWKRWDEALMQLMEKAEE